MKSTKQHMEWMDQFQIPTTLYKRLEAKVLKGLGCASKEELYETDDGREYELESRMQDIIVAGIEQQLAESREDE